MPPIPRGRSAEEAHRGGGSNDASGMSTTTPGGSGGLLERLGGKRQAAADSSCDRRLRRKLIGGGGARAACSLRREKTDRAPAVGSDRLHVERRATAELDPLGRRWSQKDFGIRRHVRQADVPGSINEDSDLRSALDDDVFYRGLVPTGDVEAEFAARTRVLDSVRCGSRRFGSRPSVLRRTSPHSPDGRRSMRRSSGCRRLRRRLPGTSHECRDLVRSRRNCSRS